MTAAELLADLTGQAFCLDLYDEGIGIEPASRLSDAQIQAIREHKPELMILLRGDMPPSVPVTASKSKKRKTRKRVAKAPVQMAEEQPPPTSQAPPPPAEAAAVPSPEPVEPPAPSVSVERTACRACGSPVFNPNEEKCWHCGNPRAAPVVLAGFIDYATMVSRGDVSASSASMRVAPAIWN
jgi:hypothetical protein